MQPLLESGQLQPNNNFKIIIIIIIVNRFLLESSSWFIPKVCPISCAAIVATDATLPLVSYKIINYSSIHKEINRQWVSDYGSQGKERGHNNNNHK